ncbi:MAG: methionine adenosyltransferase [Candidatus Aminicenantes bacterium]|nr:MAG: methionine adenosyltransferase [Candidatus Aminicenantes bacterium]
MIKGRHLFTSESVSEGHPDKVCDQVSDAILDACLEQDPESRVAVECLTKTGVMVVAGELTTRGYVNIPNIVRQTLKRIGYTKSHFGIEWETCAVFVHLEEQSPDISMGVTEGEGYFREQGAGDQGMMFGYATNETTDYMPLPINLAHKLTMKLAEVRRSGEIPYLGPDGKSQVTVEYNEGKPQRVTTVVVSNQHEDSHSHDEIEADIIRKVIKPVCGDWLTDDTKFLVNPTGKFVVGGPQADAGLTGRKIIVDTYGGMGRHGGGCFSGKDPSKVDRSGAYVARYIAKNVVAAGLADRCEIQIAYAIGVAEPVSVCVDTFGTGKLPEEKIEELVRKIFPLKPAEILNQLKLKRPIYAQTACYGHFGRDTFPWERLDKVDELKKLAKET